MELCIKFTFHRVLITIILIIILIQGKKLWKEKEENNSVLCLDYSKDGNTFATGGRDSIVKHK